MPASGDSSWGDPIPDAALTESDRGYLDLAKIAAWIATNRRSDELYLFRVTGTLESVLVPSPSCPELL